MESLIKRLSELDDLELILTSILAAAISLKFTGYSPSIQFLLSSFITSTIVLASIILSLIYEERLFHFSIFLSSFLLVKSTVDFFVVFMGISVVIFAFNITNYSLKLKAVVAHGLDVLVTSINLGGLEELNPLINLIASLIGKIPALILTKILFVVLPLAFVLDPKKDAERFILKLIIVLGLSMTCRNLIITI